MKRAILVIAALILAGCNQGQIVDTLAAIVDAAQIALPIIAPAANVDPQTVALIENYLTQVSTGAAQSASILAGPGTPAEKAAAVTRLFADLAQGCHCIPPGTPATIVNTVDAVAHAVEHFLAQLQKPKPVAVKLTPATQEKLRQIRARAEGTKERLLQRRATRP